MYLGNSPAHKSARTYTSASLPNPLAASSSFADATKKVLGQLPEQNPMPSFLACETA